MSDGNAIYAYYQKIEDGSIVVGKWIKLLYETIIEGFETKRWFFDERRANSAIGFIEKYCHHYKGALAPNRITLSLWQKAAISIMFGVVDGDGIRQFTECLFVVGRKCGKTLIAAGIETYIAYAAGEYGSEIYFLAPKLDQADLCFSAFEFNVDHEPALSRKTKSTKSRGLYIKDTNTNIKKLPFADRKSDGYGPMSWVADEVSSWKGERGLKQWEVMVSGTGARVEPFGLAISSAGYENEGLYDEMFKRGTSFLNGNSREEHLLPILYTVDDESKWDDINELRKSLPGLGESVPVKFLLKEIATAHESLSKKQEFITKYCNIKQNSARAWLQASDVKKMFTDRKPIEELVNHYCLCGIDLSQTIDLSSACLLVEDKGTIWTISHFWLPSERLAEATDRDGIPYQAMIDRGFLSLSGTEFIDYNDIFQWIEKMRKQYKLLPLQIGYDRYSSQYLISQLEQASYHCESVFQGWNLTGIEDTLEGMLREGTIKCIDDNDLLKIHMMDAAQQIETGTSAHPRKKLVKLSKNAHVDGVAAILDALCMRQNHWAEMGKRLMNAG